MRKARLQEQYIELLDRMEPCDRERTEEFFASVRARLRLANKYSILLKSDLINLFRFYLTEGMSIDEIFERINPSMLSAFYVESTINNWYPLDTAAKVYPLSISRSWMALFRLSITLKEEVNPFVLQAALDFTIKRFPCFATSVKSGFFWHYLDGTVRRYPVSRERTLPCFIMDISHRDAPSFRVLYYKNRISVEYFHILTDGTGGMIFLKTLTAEYLRLLGHRIPAEHGVCDIDEGPPQGETADAFTGLGGKGAGGGFAGTPVLQVAGRRSLVLPYQTIQYIIRTSSLKKTAKDSGNTVTSFMLAAMFMALRDSTRRKKGIIAIQVPVNMRKFYKTQSLRNFSLYVTVRLQKSEITNLSEVAQKVSQKLKESTSLSEMNKQLRSASMLVNNLAFIPNTLKKPFVILFYRLFGEATVTTT